MAVFESKYTELMFYVDGQVRQFMGGRFVTEDEKEIEVVSKLVDAMRVDEPIEETKPAEETAPAPAAAKSKKASAK